MILKLNDILRNHSQTIQHTFIVNKSAGCSKFAVASTEVLHKHVLFSFMREIKQSTNNVFNFPWLISFQTSYFELNGPDYFVKCISSPFFWFPAIYKKRADRPGC